MSVDVQVPELLLLGVGSGGTSLARAVQLQYGEKMRVICADTDALTIRNLEKEGHITPILLGGARLAGSGTGGDSVQGGLAAQDDIALITGNLQNVRTVILLACLGGGTGTGATAEIARHLHDLGMTTLCLVTTPFSFEDRSRHEIAKRTLPIIEENCDSIVQIPLDDLFAGEDGKRTLPQAIEAAEKAVASSVSLFWRLLVSPGFIRLNQEQLHRLIRTGDKARLGSASASGGEDRAVRCLDILAASPLLKRDEALKNCDSLLLGILAGSDLRLAEIGMIMDRLRELCLPSCRIEMGTVLDARFTGRIELVLMAFKSWKVVADPLLFPEKALSSQAKGGEENASPAEMELLLEVNTPSDAKRKRKSSKLHVGGDRFGNTDPTLEHGQNLDVPTYLRRKIVLER